MVNWHKVGEVLNLADLVCKL